MKSDVIIINNQEKGFSDAVREAHRAAGYRNLKKGDALQLQLLTEEMLSMVHSVTGEMQASFWIENEGKAYTLHLSTETVLDQDKRAELLSAATSRSNEAAKGFLGRLRDMFEQAMTAQAEHPETDLPEDVLVDIANHEINPPEWDGYERSTLRRLADNIKISIVGRQVEMIVTKSFDSNTKED